MALTDQTPGTYADLEALPEHMVGQIFFGVLRAHPRPAPKQARVSSRIGGQLDCPFDLGAVGQGGRIILDETEVHLGGQIVVSDIAGWRRDRLPNLPETAAYFELEPDWVCDVLSPSTARIDRTDKLKVFAGHGVGHVWLVDPDARTLEVFTFMNGHWLRLSADRDNAPVAAPPFEVHAFDLSILWAAA